MKPILKFAVFVLSTGIFFNISCQRELHFPNSKPVANAGKDTAVLLPADSAILNGSASSDPDNNITSYIWTKISGPSSSNILRSSTVKTLVNQLVAGIYQFELKVSDAGGLFSKDTIRVTVNSVIITTHPPIANAGNDTIITLPINTVTLNGNGSSDPDNNITTYAWAKISGPATFNIANANTVQTQLTNLVQGVYQFELKVTDAGGLFSKDTMQVTVNATSIISLCNNRPVINATLVPIGSLSEEGTGLVSATAGNKILFAGGIRGSGYTSRVDIYDITTNTWSTAELSNGDRQGMVAASVGNKILFAGGGDNDNGIVTSRVDIYDVSTNTWSIAELSKAREYLAATTIGNKVFFAGGGSWEPYYVGSDVVDIYDNSTNTWSTATLTEGRSYLSATSAGNKIYFAGGSRGPGSTNISTRIDIFDASTNSWTTSELKEGKSSMASIAADNKIYWASGMNSASSPGGITLSDQVEIRDINTGVSSFACMLPRYQFMAAMKNDNIVFFTGFGNDLSLDGNHFEIYNITTDTWSTVVLNQSLYGATIISVNNIIYVAGGTDDNGTNIWKLQF